MVKKKIIVNSGGGGGGSVHRLYLPRKLGERYYHVAPLLEKSGVKFFVQKCMS